MQYAIHESRFEKLEKKLAKIGRKCARFGNAFSFEICGDEYRKDKKGKIHRFVIIDVSGVAKCGNYEIAATLELTEHGNIIKRFPFFTGEIPARFRDSENHCEHCGTKRRRNDLIIVHDLETGEFKQIGRNCLADYTGILDAERFAEIQADLGELSECDGAFYYGERVTPYFGVSEILKYAAVITNKCGFFNAESNLSTRSMICCAMGIYSAFPQSPEKYIEMLNKKLKEHLFDVQFSLSDFAETPELNAQIDAIIQHFKSDETGDSDFAHNARVIVSADYCEYKHFGILACLPNCYAKHCAREMEKVERAKLNRDYFGECGKRYKGVAIKSLRQMCAYETQYGIMRIWEIVTESGNVLTWKTSNFPDDSVTRFDFTVKEFSEYKGVPQTIVTRCKFY